MSVAQVIILLGAACVSPLEPAPTITVAYKVPCAIIINDDGGKTEVAKDQARIEPTASPPPAKVKKPCKRQYYWKKGKKRYRCRR